MTETNQKDVICAHIHTSKFQAASLANNEDNLFSISTARKSSIEAKGMCAACGMRINRDDLQVCSHCGSPLCQDCKKLAEKKARRHAASRY